MEEAGSLLVQRQHALSAHSLSVGLVLRDLKPHPLCQKFNGFGEGETFHLHDEVYYTAALAAAEAVIDLLFAVYGEGRGFFAVKGAESKQVGATAL